MLKKLGSLIFVIVLLWFSSSSAATLNVKIDNLDLIPEGVYGYQLGFTVDGSWAFEESVAGTNTSSIIWNKGVEGYDGLGGVLSPYSKITPGPIPGFPDNYSNTWDLNAKLPGDTLNILSNDEGFGSNVLKNGLLLTLIYPDEVSIQLTAALFLSAEDLVSVLPIFPLQSDLLFEAGDNTLTFSANAVPIPSTLLLLGGGICVLVGHRRKKQG